MKEIAPSALCRLMLSLMMGFLPTSSVFATNALPNASELTITQAHSDLLAHKYTAQDLLQAYLDRIKKYNANYNAFTTMNPEALAEARAADERIAAGKDVGLLTGIPIAIKESVDVEGLPSTAGWAPLSKRAGGVDVFPERDAPLVVRLRAAGAVILGKTNIPPFSGDGTRANSSWAGLTYNAADRSLAPGGSSSGSATAVAASFAMVAIGEETGGSLQDPAGAQGIVGFKPTFGLVSNTGVVPVGGSTRDVLGALGRTVTDAAILLDAIAGCTAEDPKTIAAIGNIPAGGFRSKLNPDALKGKRIGLYGPGWRDQPLTPETQAIYERASQQLAAAGAILVKDPFAGSGFAALTPKTGRYDDRGQESVAYDYEKYLEHLGPHALINSLARMRQVIGKTPFDKGEPLARWSANPIAAKSLANPDAPPDFSRFYATRSAYLRLINEVFSAHKLDALVFPQMFKETPKLNSQDKIGATTVSEINIAGLPAVTVPAGAYKSDAPFALIFVGRMWSEANLIGLAYSYEQAADYRRAPLLIPAAAD